MRHLFLNACLKFSGLRCDMTENTYIHTIGELATVNSQPTSQCDRQIDVMHW